jgi:hypothetical protein
MFVADISVTVVLGLLLAFARLHSRSSEALGWWVLRIFARVSGWSCLSPPMPALGYCRKVAVTLLPGSHGLM